MNENNTPHQNGAPYHDWIYATVYGQTYQALNQASMQAATEHAPGKKVLDVGAGTGRMTIPLLQAGYEVSAIDTSAAMLDVLVAKLNELGLNAELFTGRVEAYEGGGFDLALAVFTVMSYITTNDEMDVFCKAISNKLRKGGRFMFDLPFDLFFNGGGNRPMVIPGVLHRAVQIGPTDDPNLFHYEEHCSGVFQGAEFAFNEDFNIRRWNIAELEPMLAQVGLRRVNQAFPNFNAAGMTVYLFERE